MKITGAKRKIARNAIVVMIIGTGCGIIQNTTDNPTNKPLYIRKSLKLNKRSLKLESSNGISSSIGLLNLTSKIIAK